MHLCSTFSEITKARDHVVGLVNSKKHPFCEDVKAHLNCKDEHLPKKCYGHRMCHPNREAVCVTEIRTRGARLPVLW